MANSDSKNSGAWVYVLAGLVFISVIAGGVWFYQSKQQAAPESAKAQPEVASAEQKPKSSTPAKKHEKAQKKESGGMLDKIKNIEVHGAKNPCTETQRMMKQCTD